MISSAFQLALPWRKWRWTLPSSLYSWDALLYPCLQAAGKWRQEGKSYEMQDGMNTKKLIRVEHTWLIQWQVIWFIISSMWQKIQKRNKIKSQQSKTTFNIYNLMYTKHEKYFLNVDAHLKNHQILCIFRFSLQSKTYECAYQFKNW